MDPAVPCVRMGDYALRFETELGETFEERARKELRETPEQREESLQQLIKLIENEEDLAIPVDHELFLLSYLRACKFYPESAFERMKTMYKFRAKYPKYTSNLVPDEAHRNVFEQRMLTVLPSRDQHGRRIMLAEVGSKWNPKQCSLVEVIRGVMLIVEAAVMEPKTQVSGANVIVDCMGLSLQHVWQFSPGFAKMLLEWIQECVPCRIKAIHVVNQPYIFNMLFSIFKPFIQEKLRNRIHFHGEDRASLLNFIDSKFLPSKYGGDMNLPIEQGVHLFELLSCYKDKYEKVARYGYITKKNNKEKKSQG